MVLFSGCVMVGGGLIVVADGKLMGVELIVCDKLRSVWDV